MMTGSHRKGGAAIRAAATEAGHSLKEVRVIKAKEKAKDAKNALRCAITVIAIIRIASTTTPEAKVAAKTEARTAVKANAAKAKMEEKERKEKAKANRKRERSSLKTSEAPPVKNTSSANL